ncbi:MAG: glutathione S-transferase N-terminal domain-containing protein [Woeseia sp.]
MKLYYFPGSCALAGHIVLEWIGVPYETVRMKPEDVKSAQYLALNPEGAVPLLVDGDFTLTQNVAILAYLADQYPDARLFGDGTPRGRAQILRWLALLNSDVHPAFKPIFAPARFLPDQELAGPLANAATRNIRRYFGLLDKRLEERRWLVDERSIADPYLFVMLRWAIRLEIGLDGYKNLSQFVERMYADLGVRAAIIAEEGEMIQFDSGARA